MTRLVLLAASMPFVLLGTTHAQISPPCVDEGLVVRSAAVTTTTLDLYEMFRNSYDDLTADAWLDAHEAFITHAEADNAFHRQVLELLECAF